MADDHDDASSVVLQDSCCRTLQQLTIGAERRAEGDVDAARNMASAEAGDGEVKDQRCQQVQHLPGIRGQIMRSAFYSHTVTPLPPKNKMQKQWEYMGTIIALG